MFEYLKVFRKIIVTGPQRSGTTIAGKMIAVDTEKTYYDEMRFNVGNLRKVKEILAIDDSAVIQAPGLVRHIVDLSVDDGTCIVMMIRDVADIQKSQARIDWKFEKSELLRFEDCGMDIAGLSIAEVKYKWWEQEKSKIKFPIELKYESLSEHYLWIDSKLRVNFKPKQTMFSGPKLPPIDMARRNRQNQGQ